MSLFPGRYHAEIETRSYKITTGQMDGVETCAWLVGRLPAPPTVETVISELEKKRPWLGCCPDHEQRFCPIRRGILYARHLTVSMILSAEQISLPFHIAPSGQQNMLA